MNLPDIAKRLVAATRGDRAGGVGLTAASVGALVWANWPATHSYADTWSRVAAWSPALGLQLSVRDWVNQGLLLAFFALVGAEIRREMTAGELRSLRRALLPVVAAGGGMIAPAFIYAAIVAGGAGAGGWGIPMATDVAFALGALALIGGVSTRARVFLMTLAVADDIGSIIILVGFYSEGVRAAWLLAGLLALAALAAMWWLGPPAAARIGGRVNLPRSERAGRAARTGGLTVRLLLGGAAWWAMLHAGVEAAVIGVALGAFGPGRRPSVRKPVHETAGGRLWVSRLEPAVNALVLPLFALANVGVPLGGSWIHSNAALRIFLAVAVARVVGKPLGIAAATAVTTWIDGDIYEPRIASRGIAGVGAVASIGFTVPLLIIERALPPGQLATAATLGLLGGSLLGVGAGAAVLRSGKRPGSRTARTSRPAGPAREPG